MKIKLLTLAVFFCLLGFVQGSQAECPECPPPKDPEAWVKSLAFGFNMTDGNSNTKMLNVRAKANQEKASNIWIFDIEQGWGETKNVTSGVDETNVDFTKALAQYKRLLTERFYTGLGLDWLRDDIADIKYRVTPGLIFGYFIIKNDDMKLALEAGPAYVFEEVGGIEDDYLSARIGDRYEWKISKTASVFQTADALVDPDDSDNYVINAELGVIAPLSSLLNLVLSIKNTYDNIPAAGKERNDIAVISALSVNL